MRSFTSSDLPGRCPACWIRSEHCVCSEVPSLSIRTEIVIVRHEREAAKSTGTARIAQLALPGARVVAFGDDPGEANALLQDLGDAQLLFPAEPSAPWPSGPARLVVLDGTWRQTRRMFKKLPALEALPRLWLPPKEQPVLRLRDTVFEQGRSTLEAIADALRRLEGEEVATALHALHAKYVEKVFRARGVWELKQKAFTP